METVPKRTDLPEAIAADVARELKAIGDSLEQARTVVASDGNLPATVLRELEPDPVHGRPEHRDDWFIGLLLTPKDVAAILRVSIRSISGLPLSSVAEPGERRHRQSELRR